MERSSGFRQCVLDFCAKKLCNSHVSLMILLLTNNKRIGKTSVTRKRGQTILLIAVINTVMILVECNADKRKWINIYIQPW